MTPSGAPGRSRTCGLWLRRPTLYPTELRAHRAALILVWGDRWESNPQPLEVALGLDGPRRDAVHPDALARPRRAQLAREHDAGGLGRAVVRHHRRAVDAGDRRDVDDDASALGHHLLAGPLAAEEHAVQVDADDRVPAVDRDVLGLRPERGAGVVHHDVESAELLRGPLDHGLDLIFLPHVHDHREGAAAEVADGLHDRLQVLELARADGDVGPRPGELDRDGLADAGPAARDDRNLPLEGERWFRHGGDDTPRGGAMSNENSRAGGPAAAGYGARRISSLRSERRRRLRLCGISTRPTFAVSSVVFRYVAR